MKAPIAIVISVLVLMLAFSVGCAQQNKPAVNETAPPAVVAPVNETLAQAQPCSSGNVVQKDACFLALAKTEMNPQICQNVYSIEQMDECYSIFAGTDLAICKKITNADRKWECLFANAKREKSDEICKLIENDAKRAECLKVVVPPCMLIMDENARGLCLALEKNDYSLCTSDWCLAEYARVKQTDTPCGGIKLEYYRYACAAIAKDDISICKQAKQTPVQDACIENVSKATNMPSYCGLGTPGTSYTNNCYLYFAVKNNDPTYCRKPAAEEQRDQCYTDFANRTANISVCPKIINSLNRIVCYRIAAIGNRMPSLCNGMGIEFNMRDCYAASILYIDAGPLASDCQNVAIVDWKNKCYLRAAIKANNGTLCSFVGEGPDKLDCENLFGKQN